MVPGAGLELVDTEPGEHGGELEEGGGEIDPVEGTEEPGGEGREGRGGAGAVDEEQREEAWEGKNGGGEVQNAEGEDWCVCC